MENEENKENVLTVSGGRREDVTISKEIKKVRNAFPIFGPDSCYCS